MSRARLQEQYIKELRPALQERLALKNIMQVPFLEKVVLNMGIGEAAQDRKHVTSAIEELTLISGQKAVPCRSRRAIAGFKLRENVVIGAKVTIRGARMYEFLDRLVTIAMPRIRDFRGLKPNSFDGNGNFSLGLSEQIIFPEINYDRIEKIRGLDVTICTSAKRNDHARALLEAFRFPFQS